MKEPQTGRQLRGLAVDSFLKQQCDLRLDIFPLGVYFLLCEIEHCLLQ